MVTLTSNYVPLAKSLATPFYFDVRHSPKVVDRVTVWGPRPEPTPGTTPHPLLGRPLLTPSSPERSQYTFINACIYTEYKRAGTPPSPSQPRTQGQKMRDPASGGICDFPRAVLDLQGPRECKTRGRGRGGAPGAGRGRPLRLLQGNGHRPGPLSLGHWEGQWGLWAGAATRRRSCRICQSCCRLLGPRWRRASRTLEPGRAAGRCGERPGSEPGRGPPLPSPARPQPAPLPAHLVAGSS